MKKVLVTGASGFVGGHIVHRLHELGISVRCLVRKTSDLAFIAPVHPEIVIGDMTAVTGLQSALQGVDAVIHCAGVTKAARTDVYFRVNEEGCRNLYAACMEFRSELRKIVHIGSLAALGPASVDRPVTEDSPPHPVSDYGRSKLAGQRIAEAHMCELPVSVVLPPAVYGPRDRDFLTYFKLVSLGITPIVGRDPRYLSLIHAGDLAAAVSHVLLNDAATGRSYLVDDGTVYTWADVADAIGRAIGKKALPVHLPVFGARLVGSAGDLLAWLTGREILLDSGKVEEMLQPAWTCSAARIRDELGYTPRYGLDEGMRNTLSWYRENRWL
jgi:nucleoside-diphosphate-sugar epimerase